jgi:uncharacterized protein
VSAPRSTARRAPAPLWDPYRSGVALGLVLLATFVVMGRGLGASGAFASCVSWAVGLVAPAHAEARSYFADYLARGFDHPLLNWLVFEVAGVAIGGLLSAALAGRLARRIEKGPRISVAVRLALALAGGALTAWGAALARGCTSGQALTGGALLNSGSWMFMLTMFASAYAAAALVRRAWR